LSGKSTLAARAQENWSTRRLSRPSLPSFPPLFFSFGGLEMPVKELDDDVEETVADDAGAVARAR
jgi:hypothetical protein